jgi:uncharacterized protein (TIGR02594 family)
MIVTPYGIAQRFIGLKEVPGVASNPAILAMLRLDNVDIPSDDVPWCSAFVNYIAWLLRLPRSKSLAARSWLAVGTAVPLVEAQPGWDIVVLSRGDVPQPGPEVLSAPGHVGFYAGHDASVAVLGGNQADSVSVMRFARDRVLGVRRLLV